MNWQLENTEPFSSTCCTFYFVHVIASLAFTVVHLPIFIHIVVVVVVLARLLQLSTAVLLLGLLPKSTRSSHITTKLIQFIICTLQLCKLRSFFILYYEIALFTTTTPGLTNHNHCKIVRVPSAIHDHRVVVANKKKDNFGHMFQQQPAM